MGKKELKKLFKIIIGKQMIWATRSESQSTDC